MGAVGNSLSALQDYAAQTNSAYGLPAGLTSAVIQNESAWNPAAYNPASGATGLGQFLPSTAANPGYGALPFDPTNPQNSINGVSSYLSGLHNALGSWTAALNQYSGGAPYGQAIGQSLDAGNGVPASTGGAQTGGGSWLSNLFGGASALNTGNYSAGDAGGIVGQYGGASGGLLSGLGNILSDGFMLLLAVIIIGVGLWALSK